jgi:deoxyribodipyrimidine photo-lyase
MKKQILWFRRDLRITDNAILHHANGEVLPIFIFDTNILSKLPKDDKRVTFIFKSVLDLKAKLQNSGLDLKIYYGDPKDIFENLKENFNEVLCSCDFDSYSISRDNEIESLLAMHRFYDSFLIHPNDALKNDGTPYKVFTPFYKSLSILWESDAIEEFEVSKNIILAKEDFSQELTLEKMGFEKQTLSDFLYKTPRILLEELETKLDSYQKDRDFFYKDGTSNLSVHLRFGLVSPREVFNYVKQFPHCDFYIRELFWREFYSYILYHFPYSEQENFNHKQIKWNENEEYFKSWCEGNTGVAIIDAAMRHLNITGQMHNRLRMIVASYLTKNLFLPWQWGEQYFAKKLLDYEASSNVGSWQWGASTGADSVPYFRVFNPYTQSKKFDKDGIFIKSVIPELAEYNPKEFHNENGIKSDLFSSYPAPIVNIKLSRQSAIERFRDA